MDGGRRRSKVGVVTSAVGSKSAIGVDSRVASATKSYQGRTSRIGVRRQSFGYGKLVALKSDSKNLQSEVQYKRPPLLFMNTYQLEPRVKFHCDNVLKAAESVMDDMFEGHLYNPQESPALALRIAGELKRVVKSMHFDRYRVLAVVTLGQKRAQSYNNAITFLWDHLRDNYVNTQRETRTAFIQVTVFGVYLD